MHFTSGEREDADCVLFEKVGPGGKAWLNRGDYRKRASCFLGWTKKSMERVMRLDEKRRKKKSALGRLSDDTRNSAVWDSALVLSATRGA